MRSFTVQLTSLEKEVFEEMVECNPGVTAEQLIETYDHNRFHYWAMEAPPSISKPALTDISSLSRLTNLEQIELHNCAVSDLSPLSSLSGLTKIHINNNKTNIASCDFQGLENLSFLCLSDFKVIIPKISGLQNLKKIILRNCSICDLSPLENLSNLEYIWIGNNPDLQDLSPLSFCKNLNEIMANDTAVKDISPLKDLPHLQRLTLSNTKITDVSALAEIPTLEMIWLYGTPVTDVSSLAKLPLLNDLNLIKTSVTDLSAFQDRMDIIRIERKKLGKSKCKKSMAEIKQETVCLKEKVKGLGIVLHPCLKNAQIKMFEESHGVKLPKEYIAVLTQIGNGFDCEHSLNTLEQSVFAPEHVAKRFDFHEAWIWEDDENIDEARICAATQNGQLRLMDVGCGRSFSLIVCGSAKGEVWEITDVGISPYNNGADFLCWLKDLLDGKID